MNRRSFLSSAMAFGGLAALHGSGLAFAGDRGPKANAVGRVVRTDGEWRRRLTPEQYEVTRRGGTESPYSSPLDKQYARGTYLCVCCDLPLFSSKAKYNSRTGWPSFWAPASKKHVREHEDRSLAEVRTEVLCARCDAHLGHVFDDGPPPTGLRYCMNGVALKFVPGKA
ncbi:MAG: peptide-methionine (R)-S-oxide reductase MsrB [Acidobacteria bacterium]|nr:peptide-methionine (R)-S-oxide reductase MsrB [Acidobacteriota bacterium]